MRIINPSDSRRNSQCVISTPALRDLAYNRHYLSHSESTTMYPQARFFIRTALLWLVPGALIAILPGLGGFPGARTLLLPNLGFAALKDNKVIDMLYVHPHHAGEGVGTALCGALEKIAAARGAEAISVEASESALAFFEGRGYAPARRNSLPIGDQWLTNTTMTKPLKPADAAKRN